MNPFTLLPPGARKAVYAAYGGVALLVACIDVGFASSGSVDPVWLKVTQDVLAYLAAPVGVLAASNTPASAAEVAEAVAEVETPVEADELFEDEDNPDLNEGLPVEPEQPNGNDLKAVYGKDANDH